MPQLTSVKLRGFKRMELTYEKGKHTDGVKASTKPDSCVQDCMLSQFEETLRKFLSRKQRTVP